MIGGKRGRERRMVNAHPLQFRFRSRIAFFALGKSYRLVFCIFNVGSGRVGQKRHIRNPRLYEAARVSSNRHGGRLPAAWS